MALLRVIGFDLYTNFAEFDASPDIDVVNTGDMSLNATGGRFGGQCLETSRVDRPFGINLATTQVNLLTQFAMRFEPRDNSGSRNPIWRVVRNTQASNTQTGCHALLEMRGDGTLILQNSAETDIATVVQAIKPGAWHYLQIDITLNATTGACTVILDGVTIINVTNQNFSDAASTATDFISIGSHDFTRFDDIIVMDGTGAVFNALIGDVEITSLIPDGDGAVAAWAVTGAAANWQAVDDPLGAPDEDTTFISSAVLNQINRATLANVSGTPTTLHAVAGNVRARNDGANNVAIDILSVATASQGADKTLTASYIWHQSIFEADPNGPTTWTTATVNALELGVLRR